MRKVQTRCCLTCFRGALPPVDLRAVCFVLAMMLMLLSEFFVQSWQQLG